MMLHSQQSSVQMVKEAMSKRDFMSTLMAMLSFLMLPKETRTENNMDDWITSKGGNPQAALQIAKAVGKDDPKDVTVNELKTNFKDSPEALTTPSVPTGKIDDKNTEKPEQAVPYQSYWQGRDKKYRKELNEEVVDNSINLMRRVNSLLKELGVNNATVTSGWRPRSYNEELRRRGIPAALNSRHITGEAVDLADVGQTISKAVMKNPSILDKYGLWMEHPSRTRNWVHFDLGSGRNADRMPDGSKRKNRIFNP